MTPRLRGGVPEVAAMLRTALLFCAFLAGVMLAATPPPAVAAAVPVRWETMLLPVSIDGRAYRLDALLLYPDDGRAHPLAVVSHGSPRSASDRPGLSPASNAEQMLWFARRGWSVVAVLRRGYGRSEGGWAETYGSCADPDYVGAGLRGAADIAATIRALANDPHVDASRVLAVGVSAGAFATVALTSAPPPGLAGAIAFAPGRGSPGADQVCAQDRLVAAFATFGRTSRVPILWISAPNDHFFGPTLVRRSVAAFDGAGGRATFFATPPYGSEGHYLFGATDAIPMWEAAASTFFVKNGLELVAQPLDLAGETEPAPRALGPKGRVAFARYGLEPPHKAFALSPDGSYGFAYGARTTEVAAQRALAACPKAAHENCAIVDREGSAVR